MISGFMMLSSFTVVFCREVVMFRSLMVVLRAFV